MLKAKKAIFTIALINQLFCSMDQTMPIRLPQNGELEYDPVHVRLPPDTVRVPETLP